MRFVIVALLIISQISLRAQSGSIIPGDLLAQLAANASPRLIQQRLNAAYPDLHLRYDHCLSRRAGLHLFHYDPRTTSAETALRRLRQQTGVLIAQHNHQVSLRHTQATIPDDPSFAQQWGLNNTGQTGGLTDADIDAPEAWDRTTGGISALGDTIVVAVIDDGFDLFHEDLTYWRNTDEIPNNNLDDDANGYIDDAFGWDAYDSDGSIPNREHGTEVAGVIGAKGNNGLGGSGVNWQVQIMPIAGASGTEAVVLEAYGYLLEQRRRYDETQGEQGALVVVSNSSFGINNANPSQYPLWCAMYDSLGQAGILNVAATMNVNTNVESAGDIPSLCTSDYLLITTNSTQQDQRNGGAAYGNTSVDLAAPGTNIFTTLPSDNYGSRTGTSFAAPFVAGTVALLFADACPALMLRYRNDPANTVLQIRDAILRGVDSLSTLSGLVVTGGRLNALRSLMELEDICSNLPSDCLPPYQLVPEPLSDTSVALTWSAVDSSQTFRLRYRVAGSGNWQDSLPFSGTLTDTLYDLSSCTSYEWQVGTICPDGGVEYAPSRSFSTLGCCEAPNQVALSQLTDSSVALSWPSVYGAGQYMIRYRVLSASNYDSLLVDTPAVSLTGLSACTNHAWQIRSLCGSNSAGYGSQRTFQTLGCGACLDLPYCGSQGQDVDFEWIDRVVLGSIDNQSGSNTGYAAFTDVNYVLPVDTPLSVRLVPGFALNRFDEAWRIWIDLDRDGTFSETERLLDSGPTQFTVESTLTIPDSIEGGPTRMRVSMSWAGFDGTQRPNSCGSFSNGEVEDYCVVLLPRSEQPCPAPAQVSADFIPGSDSLRIRWLDIPQADSFLLSLIDPSGDSSIIQYVRGTELRLGDLPLCQEYQLVIRPRCGAILGTATTPIDLYSRGCGPCRDFPYCPSQGTGDSLWIESFSLGEIKNGSGSDAGYGDYTELSQTLRRGSIQPIQLIAGHTGADRPVHWQVWVDWDQDGNFWFFDQWINQTAMAGDTLAGEVSLPTGVAGGSVRLRVSLREGQPAGVCEIFQRGEVEDYCLFLTPGVQIEQPKGGWRVYPNPARSQVNLKAPAPMQSIRLIDLMGREVLLQPGQQRTQLSVALPRLVAGVYWLEITTPQGIHRTPLRVQ